MSDERAAETDADGSPGSDGDDEEDGEDDQRGGRLDTVVDVVLEVLDLF